MDKKYLITNDELKIKALDLNDYAVDESYVDAIIINANELLNTRIKKLNDNIKSDSDISTFLGNDAEKIKNYKKAQFRVIYNLVFLGDNDPLDQQVNDIIVYDLGLGKINGFQKGWF